MARITKLLRWTLVSIVALLLIATIVAVFWLASGSGTSKESNCDIDRKLFETAGSRSVETTERSIPGVRLFRFHRNRSPEYSSIIGCRPSGELLQSDEVFELLSPGVSSPNEIAELHAWTFAVGGFGTVEVVKTPERFVALCGDAERFTPASLRSGIATYWRADTSENRRPKTECYLHLVDSRTGLGGIAGGVDPPWLVDRTAILSVLSDPRGGSGAFPRLAVAPRRDVSAELVAAIQKEPSPEQRYLGLMGLRGDAGVDQIEALVHFAEDPSFPLVRMGVVQTLATIPGGRPHAMPIRDREQDLRARRLMDDVLKSP